MNHKHEGSKAVYEPEPLGSVRIYVDNRIKYGNVLPTKDRKHLRCNAKTLKDIKLHIDMAQRESDVTRTLWGYAYRPFIQKPKYLIKVGYR